MRRQPRGDRPDGGARKYLGDGEGRHGWARGVMVSGRHSRVIGMFPPAELWVGGERGACVSRALCTPCPPLRGLKSFSPHISTSLSNLWMSAAVRGSEQDKLAGFPNLCLLPLKLQNVFSPARTSATAKPFFFHTTLEMLYKSYTTAPNYSTTFQEGVCRHCLYDPAVMKYCVRKQDKPHRGLSVYKTHFLHERFSKFQLASASALAKVIISILFH